MARRTLTHIRNDQSARLEDVTFMAATGETPDGAARRLGLRLDTLDKWCDRHAPDLWHRLRANAQPPHLRRSA